MSDIRDAGPRLRQMNDVLEENERLIGRLAWTERERDSLRRSIKNLAAYVAELNAEIESLRALVCPEPYVKSDEKRVLYDTTRADAIAETIRAVTTPPAATQEPVAWAVEDERGLQLECHPFASHARYVARTYRSDGIEGKVVPLYRAPQTCPHVRGTVTQHCSLNFTLTDEEREAVEQAIDAANGMAQAEPWAVAALRSLLERLK